MELINLGNKMHKFSLSIILALLMITGCRTLDPSALHVSVVEKSSEGCKNLGVVNINWSWWGTSTESLNTLRNQVAEKGGDTLVLTGDETGIAYECKNVKKTSSL